MSFYGTKAAFNLWNPRVPSINHFSLAQMWVSAGAPPAENIIEVGWTVSIAIYLRTEGPFGIFFFSASVLKLYFF